MNPVFAHAEALSSAFSGGFLFGLVAGAVSFFLLCCVVEWWRSRS